jgi:nitroreductase
MSTSAEFATDCIEPTALAKTLDALLTAASRAPSGDNTQPWRFEVDTEARRISLLLDETRDPSPMNSGQRMARIALGACLENLLRTAPRYGWIAELEEASPPVQAAIHLREGTRQSDHLGRAIPERVTNRRFYDGRPVPEEVMAQLRWDMAVFRRVTTHWILDRARLGALAGLIGRADATMFRSPALRQAILSQIHFDLPAGAEPEEGMSPASLELNLMERLVLRLLPRLPNWLVRYSGILGGFAAKTRRLVQSASGLCLLVAPDEAPQTDLHVGQTMQCLWLALTAQGLAVQPMMSLLVLENILDQGSPEMLNTLGRTRLTALRDEFRLLAPEIGEGRPAFLLRFGYAPPPSGRTARRPF